MKPFRFRLATLLRLREAARDARRQRLAEALQALDVLASQRGEIDRQLVELRDAREQASTPGTLDIDRLVAMHQHQVVLQAQRQQLDEQQRQVAAEADRRREALVAADRDVRVLEKLRESQRQRYRHAEYAELHKHLDEIAGQTQPAGWHQEGLRAWAD